MLWQRYFKKQICRVVDVMAEQQFVLEHLIFILSCNSFACFNCYFVMIQGQNKPEPKDLWLEPFVPASSWKPCADQRNWEPNSLALFPLFPLFLLLCMCTFEQLHTSVLRVLAFSWISYRLEHSDS